MGTEGFEPPSNGNFKASGAVYVAGLHHAPLVFWLIIMFLNLMPSKSFSFYH
jgi:hypothetical protein